MSTMSMTAAEYLANPDETRRTDLVEGVVVVNEPRRLHQRVVLEIVVALRAWTTGAPGRGEVSMPLDVAIDERNVYAPDVLWYAEGRVPPLHADRPYAVPDLAVEVRSASTWRHDIGDKKAGYERAGLAELWLVDTAADVVLGFRRSALGAGTFDIALEWAHGDTLTSPLLPGFVLALDGLFGSDELPT
jgi:Uma2 family endonuclease